MADAMNNRRGIAIYQTADGQTQIKVNLHDETVWLSQKQMAELFGVKTPAINKHLSHIFLDGELKEDLVVSILETTSQHGAHKGKTQSRPTRFYNLDAIISVGYRINSQRATSFRVWATQILRRYLTDGYAINEVRLKQEQRRVLSLKQTISLLSRSLLKRTESLDEAQKVAALLDTFAQGLDLLDAYDHQTLENVGKNKKDAVRITEKDYLSVIKKMKPAYASDVFAKPKDNSFDSSINQIYQTFGGKDLYPTLEEKAAMLLYLITKNHSFADGNKRIAASCFLYFLSRNKILFCNGASAIDNHTLFTLTLLIAESKPEERGTILKVILSVLNGGRIQLKGESDK